MSQIIPKIIHQIWLGDGDVPIKYLSFIDSWKSHHPDWEYHLWTVDHLIPLRNQRSYDQTTDVVQKTNIVRYEVLYQYGGIYVELDTACLKILNLYWMMSNFLWKLKMIFIFLMN